MATPLNRKIITGSTTPVGTALKEKMIASKLELQTVAIDGIKLWGDNPRKNDSAVPKLAKLLEQHGQKSPIVVWKKNRVIYKGNTTWKAAKQLGWKTIQILLVDFPSEQAAIAYGIADNKASEWSDWDDTVLSEMLKADTKGYFSKENTGLSDKELAGLKMSAEMPDQLESMDMQGEIQTMGDFLVLQFEDREAFLAFKERFGLGKQERTLLYSDLAEHLVEV
jgi:hypothetical protein